MAEMSESDKKLLEEVDFLREKYFTYDLPMPFCGLTLYPVTVRNYNEFLTSNSCFLINKNDDVNGISKTHLDYLICKMQDKDEGGMWSMRFSRLIELIFHIKNGMKCDKCGKFFSFEEIIKSLEDAKKRKEAGEAVDEKSLLSCECGGTLKEMIRISKDEKTNKSILIIDGHTINSEQFKKLRRFPLYQNLPDYKDDSWVDQAIREDQAAKAELLGRKQSAKATLERKIVCVATGMNYKIDEIFDMPIRKFLMALGIIDKKISYEAERIGLMTGMVSTKKGYQVDHWIYERDNGMYGAAVDADSYVSEIKKA